jgi:hypothetical protein
LSAHTVSKTVFAAMASEESADRSTNKTGHLHFDIFRTKCLSAPRSTALGFYARPGVSTRFPDPSFQRIAGAARRGRSSNGRAKRQNPYDGKGVVMTAMPQKATISDGEAEGQCHDATRATD